jgi:hypothetical protein
MKRRKIEGKSDAQMVLFPPTISQDHFELWQRLKGWYGTHLVFIVLDGYYVTMGDDAVLAAQLTDRMPDRGDGFEAIIIPQEDFTGLVAALTLAGRMVAICDPPEDPTRHLFT